MFLIIEFDFIIFRLQAEIKLLQDEVINKKDLIEHYEKQISLLERQISSRGKCFRRLCRVENSN